MLPNSKTTCTYYVPVTLFEEFKENMAYRLDARGSMAAHPHMVIPSFLYE